tara:strand:+ start:1947 stop:2390 length:444 start_codon:yes stop_codon:yes gene_type:complete
MTTNSPHYSLTYHDPLRTTMQHIASGQEVITDAPVDNNGLGQAFSPTDLVSAALASCVMTIMGIKAKDMGLSIGSMHASVRKTMASNPRRIDCIDIVLKIDVPGVTEKQRELLERTTRACPVARSLHGDVTKNVSFDWSQSQTSTSE